MTRTHGLSESQTSLIVNSLRVAAETYLDDARACAADSPQLWKQFRKQHEDAKALADLIEESEGLAIIAESSK